MQHASHQNPYASSAPHAAGAAPLSPRPSAIPNAILHVQNLTKVYSDTGKTVATRALNGMSLDVYQGEFISIMGPSGSGKTTLLNILAGLDRPTSGEVWLQGENLAAVKASELALFRRRNLGFVFQDFNLLDTLTLAENVALPLSLARARGDDIEQRVRELMQALGLAEQMRRYPYEVSGGQQQRTAVARAIIHRPRLLLADEPTGNLDSASARSLLELFAQLNCERQATILLVTHDPFSASYSQRVVFIKDGRVFTQLQRRDVQPTAQPGIRSGIQPGAQQQFFASILSTLAQLEGNHGGQQ